MIFRNSYLVLKRVVRHESNQGQVLRHLNKFMGWQLWKRTIRKPFTIKLFNGYRFRAYPDCHESSGAIYFNIPHFRELDIIRGKLNGGLIIDVGANVGLFTLLLADRVRHAILFEPNPIAAQRARENLKLNCLDFEVNEYALSDREGEILIEDKGGVDSTNRTLIDSAMTSFQTRRVRRTTLDNFIGNHKDSICSIDFIKIDVEGHENSVLNGMRTTLMKLRPKMVMFEYLQRTDFRETKKFFDSVKFNIYRLNRQRDLVHVLEQPKPLQNLFAFPAEDCIENK